jgi:ABC-2 type transport system permease protein
MSPDIARLDLRLRRRSTLAYCIGFVAYALLIVALYPSFKADASLDDLTRGNPTLGALFGATGSLTSPDGWMNANLYANFVPLFVLLMTIGYAAGAIAGQDEDGTLGGLASLPLTRGRVLGEKVASLGALSLPIPVVTLAAALLGPAFDLDLGTRALLGATLGVVLMGFDLGLVALAVGAWTGRRGAALGVAAVASSVRRTQPVRLCRRGSPGRYAARSRRAGRSRTGGWGSRARRAGRRGCWPRSPRRGRRRRRGRGGRP